MNSQIPRLDMSNVVKSFGNVRVLNGVNFHAMPGEIVALLGSNGAGKSTLMKILTAVYTKDEGTIKVNGCETQFSTPRDASRVGITFLPQEISVFPDLSVAENICLSADKVGLVDWKKNVIRAKIVLDDLGFGHLSPTAIVGNLTVAEQRIVEIARALEGAADVLVMDEPTASLSEQESEQIFAILKQLTARGTSVVYISHYLKEVFEISDRVVVLRDGTNVGDFDPQTATVAEVVDAMLGKAAGVLFVERDALPADLPVTFSAQNLSLGDLIDRVSFKVHQGEVLGVFGLIGSGVDVLGRLVFGAEGPQTSGTMQLNGMPYGAKSPRFGRDQGFGFVTAERKTDGILANLTVRENLVAPFQTDFGMGCFTNESAEAIETKKWIDRLSVKAVGTEQEIRHLSGGNQQKICVARWLNPRVKMLILEEPTRGVDIGARREIYNQLVAFAREGLAILVLSSDVEEVAGLSDRSLVIDRGRIVAEFARGATPADLLAATAH